MKKIEPLDLSVAGLAALSCLLILLKIPVWSLFIGWAWYYTLGGKPGIFKQATPPMLAGSLLAILAFILIDMFSSVMPGIVATMIAVFITVFTLMIVLKFPAFSTSLVAFNAYSCVFIGYAAKAYMSVGGMPPLLNAFIWITGANFLGLIFGWFSLEVEKMMKSAQAK